MPDIVIRGYEELYKEIEDLEIVPKRKTKALKAAGEAAKADVEKATPVRSGKTRKSWKITHGTTKEGITQVTLKGSSHADIELEFGAGGKHKHVGFFSRTIDANLEKYIKIIIEGVK